jgi:hypothetical protein
MRKQRAISTIKADAMKLRKEVSRYPNRSPQNIPPTGFVLNIPESLPAGMRPLSWVGVFGGADMAAAWLEGYHAGTQHAINVIGGKQ